MINHLLLSKKTYWKKFLDILNYIEKIRNFAVLILQKNIGFIREISRFDNDII